MVHKTLYVLLGLITFHATIASGQDLYRGTTTPFPIPSTDTLYGAYFTVSGLPQSALVTGMDVHFTGYHPNPPEFRVFFTDWLPNSGTWSTKIDLYSGLGPIDSDVDSTTALNWLPANNLWTIWGWDTNPATQGDGEITEWWFRMYFYCDSCPYIYDSRINNWFPGAAEDRDTSGYFEVFEFDVDIDADVLGENFPVRAKIMADGQAWEDWTPTWDVSWYAQEYQPWPYSQEDFFGLLSGPTDLNFWVELWNPGNDVRYDKFPWIIQGGPIPVEPDFPDLRSAWITNLQYGIDADADSYYETFQFAIAVDADCPACTQWVAAKIFSVSTVPNIEFQTPAWEISGTQIDSNRAWFSELDFTGFQGNTDLYFIVELWNAGFTRFYRQDIVLQSIKADNNVLPEIVDVAGHARYLDKDNDSLPIRYAQVKITDWDLPVFYYWTSTDSLGYYSLTIPNDPDGDLTGADIEVQVFSVGEGDVNPIPGQNHDMIEVKDTSGSLYGQPSTISADNTNPWLTVDLTAPNMDTLDGAFCVYDAGIEGYLRSYEYFSPPWNPLSLPKLTIRWPDTATYYSNNFNQIRAERGERWDRDVILHEYGHFLADIRHFADADVGTTGDHTWLADLRHFPDSSIRTEEQARNLAFREAWASWFAIAVQYDRTGSTILYNIRNRDDLPGSYQYEDQLDLERANLLLLRPGQYCEGMNAGLLWDMYDEV